MKKLYIVVSILICTTGLFSQTFVDDFESYSVGDYIGVNNPTWTTWSGTTGGAEDAKVTDNLASNGTKSIYFSSVTSSGGPQDVVLPFGGAHSTGQFTYKSSFFVETGKGAYFNFQGSQTIGQVYSMNCMMVQNGDLILDNGDGSVLLSTTYPTNTWFDFEITINLNSNSWELFIDGTSKGVFQNSINSVASLDLYPVNSSYGGNNISAFYVDEVSYSHLPYTLPTVNGAVTEIKNINRLAGQPVSPIVKIRNLGIQPITSCVVEITYNGLTFTENLSGLSLNSYDVYDLEFNQNIPLIGGANTMVATIKNINGNGLDDDSVDDSKSVVIDPIVPASGKIVVAEEGTGTWCGWCPRGAVALENMEHDYGQFFLGIAVHDKDPMTVPAYDNGLGISSFPGAVTDRSAPVNPTLIEAEFLNRIIVPPVAFLTNGIFHDTINNKLYVSVKVDFKANISGDYRVACAVTEDSVTGTDDGYKQSNYYAGGNSGEMGGYESLPNPVPADQMVYDHVARAILPSFSGKVNSFPATVNSGDIHYLSFAFDIDQTWNLDKINVVSLLIEPSGRIDNAGTANIVEGVENGYYYLGMENITSITKPVIYPNPANGMVYLKLLLEKEEQVSVKIYDLSGKLVMIKNKFQPKGATQLPIDINHIAAGVYQVKIEINNQSFSKKLTIN